VSEDWVDVRLADLVDIKHGFAFKGEYFSDEPTDVVLLSPGNFAIGGGFQFNKLKYYKDGPIPPEYVLQQGDLLVTMTDLSKAGDTLGYSAVVPESSSALLHNQRLGKVTIKSDKVDLEFIHWLLRDNRYRAEVLGSATGSTVKHTSPGRIGAYHFRLPPLREQLAISATLGTLDDKIELNRRMNGTLEAMARALFRDWFVDFGPTRAKMAGEAPYLSPDLWSIFPDRLDDAGKPEGWEEKPLTAFFMIIGGGTPKTSNPAFWDGPIPWFSVKDTPAQGSVFVTATEKTITEAGLIGSSARLILKGTTIISARGTVGNLAVAGCAMTFNQSCYALSGAGSVGDCATYLIAQNMVSQLQAMAHGSVFSTITRQTFDALSLPMPPPSILTAFEDAVSPLFEMILANVNESQTLAQTRDLLLPRLMSGELRVQDLPEIMGGGI
jgi:type I restriction enzyme S subunit